jgi:probable HAF family extracellular repeat protein
VATRVRIFIITVVATTLGTLAGAGVASGATPPFPVTFINGGSINESGHTVGSTTTPGGEEEYAVFSAKGDVVTVLDAPATGLGAEFTDLNDHGLAVGFGFKPTTPGSVAQIPLAWDKEGNVIELPLLNEDPATRGIAHSINNRGSIAGYSSDLLPAPWGGLIQTHQPVVWAPSGQGGYTVVRLALPEGTSSGEASGINNAGVVVGTILLDGSVLPVVWDAKGAMSVLPVAPGDSYTTADAINNRGQIVGTAKTDTDGTFHAVLWTPQPGGGYTVTDLGVLSENSFAHDINDRGEVVGHGHSAEEPVGHQTAIMWKPLPGGGYTIVDLGRLPGFEDSDAWDINNKGQITGSMGDAPVRWDQRGARPA